MPINPDTSSSAFGAGASLLQPKKIETTRSGLGTDLMKKINDGEITKALSADLEKVRREITENCEELIEQGARVRPLISGKQQIGWVRGLHLAERKLLRRWLYGTNDFLEAILTTASSFSKADLVNFSGSEINGLARLVFKMSDYDMTLYPYLSAFVTTTASENLWYGKGNVLSSYEHRVIHMPNGNEMKILTPPDHARLWATLCQYREAAKRRLDDNWNALMIAQPIAGRSTEPLRAELKAAQRNLLVDAIGPWERIIKREEVSNLDNGWGHSMNDDSVEGLQRELKGMAEGDKHERLMEKFYQQQKAEAEAEELRIRNLSHQHGGPGVTTEIGGILTDKDVLDREKALRKGRPVGNRAQREVVVNPQEKILQYK